MRYLIVGCGRVGSTLAKLLVADKHTSSSWTKIPPRSSDWAIASAAKSRSDGDRLRRAQARRAERADGFVAVTAGDNGNVMAALIAKRCSASRRSSRASTIPRASLYQRNSGSRRFRRPPSARRSSATD